MIDRRGLFGAAALAGVAAAIPARADDAADARLKTDWPWLGRYAEDNRRLIASGARTGIVFMGDSITQGWIDKRPGFFTAGRVDRGIGGQTTPQMLCRMMADVVALKPKVLHLMAGTNDIAGNTGPMTIAQTQDNLLAMAQLARANHICVLLASVPPAANFPWRPGLETVAPIRAINNWLARTAPALGATFVDYTPVLATPEGGMKPGLAYDGVHPTAAGYDAMAGVLEPVLKRLGV
ncbi:GDSL family lipase [Sphingomonas ginsenosidimutans]|jgi:lysophospholipase L1-like esterase|uniref:GDSL family lipase n=1 Tax=Sphingomonas ginsenosidimutans TaxID=862134 RepID=A0A2A4I368_9SPHN|nr:GDSL-type esterase/lipase family protein [Sphingomonas ginsenosidimutans]PCG10731.1 GDSL family lipase [Sphingomonas ginsenosidimutans]